MDNNLRNILLWILLFIVICFLILPIHISPSNEDEELNQQQFNHFTLTFGKSYKTSQEKERRFAAFKKSLSEIRRLNHHHHDVNDHPVNQGLKVKSWEPGMPKNKGAALYGLSPFADLTPEEFKSQYLNPEMLIHIKKHMTSHHHPEVDRPFENLITRRKRSIRPAKLDWRSKGIITPIKQQGSCGACWAYSSVETVESMNALATGKLEVLSVQQVVDCAKNGNNLGCNGGDTCTAIEWMTGRQLATESQYPATVRSGSCQLLSANQGVRVNSNYTCKSFVGNEDGMKDILANHGPLTIAVDGSNWQYYVGGIIQWNCEANLNHAAQIVGYDDSGETPYFIVRNSWGTFFGDRGYLYIASGSNLCGIASRVSSLSTV